MKRFLLFAGTETAKNVGVNGLVGDFDSVAEAFVSLTDNQTPSEWWHVLDTQTGEVIDRRHLRVKDSMVGFQKSDWIVGGQTQKATSPITVPAGKAAVLPAAVNLDHLEKDLQAAVGTNGSKPNGHANGHTNGAHA